MGPLSLSPFSKILKQKKKRNLINLKVNNIILCLPYIGTVVPAKSDSDIIVCLQFLRKSINLNTPLLLTRIDRSLVYKSYPADRINTEEIYRFLCLDNFVNKTGRHCHSWLAGQ